MALLLLRWDGTTGLHRPRPSSRIRNARKSRRCPKKSAGSVLVPTPLARKYNIANSCNFCQRFFLSFCLQSGDILSMLFRNCTAPCYLGSTQELVYPRHGADPLMMRWDWDRVGISFPACCLMLTRGMPQTEKPSLFSEKMPFTRP